MTESPSQAHFLQPIPDLPKCAELNLRLSRIPCLGLRNMLPVSPPSPWPNLVPACGTSHPASSWGPGRHEANGAKQHQRPGQWTWHPSHGIATAESHGSKRRVLCSFVGCVCLSHLATQKMVEAGTAGLSCTELDCPSRSCVSACGKVPSCCSPFPPTDNSEGQRPLALSRPKHIRIPTLGLASETTSISLEPGLENTLLGAQPMHAKVAAATLQDL